MTDQDLVASTCIGAVLLLQNMDGGSPNLKSKGSHV